MKWLLPWVLFSTASLPVLAADFQFSLHNDTSQDALVVLRKSGGHWNDPLGAETTTRTILLLPGDYTGDVVCTGCNHVTLDSVNSYQLNHPVREVEPSDVRIYPSGGSLAV